MLIRDIVSPNCYTISNTETIGTAIETLKKLNLDELPVVNSNGLICGVFNLFSICNFYENKINNTTPIKDYVVLIKYSVNDDMDINDILNVPQNYFLVKNKNGIYNILNKHKYRNVFVILIK